MVSGNPTRLRGKFRPSWSGASLLTSRNICLTDQPGAHTKKVHTGDFSFVFPTFPPEVIALLFIRMVQPSFPSSLPREEEI